MPKQLNKIMAKGKVRVSDEAMALIVFGKVNPSGQYRATKEEKKRIKELREGEVTEVKQKAKSVSNKLKTDSKGYVTEEPIFSAWDEKNKKTLDIKEFCEKYNMNYNDINTWKLLPYHYKVPTYNIEFKTKRNESESIDFDKILSKYENFKPSKGHVSLPIGKNVGDFDVLTYSDVHIAMDTNADNNSMYSEPWYKKDILESLDEMIVRTIASKSSSVLVIDELGDFLDGLNGYTTRGGHSLPQLMTDEEAFDLALEFKIDLIDSLHNQFSEIIVNNICNDNHAGSFGYFVNSAAKNIIENKYRNVTVNNCRQFINHYYIDDVCFIITHGKDDKTLKFGFKPQLDSKGLEKIDQYCKQNDIYKTAKRIVFKKGDSHQALFDMCTSDDFYYFNYPALSPSSQWVQNNFKKGRRGFVLETWSDLDVTIKPIFL